MDPLNSIDQNEEEENENELPEYSDDEDYRKLMNDAIMKKMEIDEKQEQKVEFKKKKKQIPLNNIKTNSLDNAARSSLGSFLTKLDENKPKVFVSKRKLEKTRGSVQTKRCFNPRLPPYLLSIKNNTESKYLNEDNFPSL